MDRVGKSHISALVVDDNEVNRVILVTMLQIFHIHADQAVSGKEAILLSEENAYDLILIDHIMPEMNGVRTTSAIRRTALNKEDVVIIALTADLTENIRNAYLEVKADDVYSKPVELKDLTSIFHKWNFNIQQDYAKRTEHTNISAAKYELIKSIIETIDDVDYDTGLKYAAGNLNNFINILEVSLKDLHSCIIIMNKSYKNNAFDELKMGIHKLKNVLLCIGALKLTKEATDFEKELIGRNMSGIASSYMVLLSKLNVFEDKLQITLEDIKAAGLLDRNNLDSSETPMSVFEYEQSYSKAIYYIRRYEFDSIIRELDRLILRGLPECREELILTRSDIRNYDYDLALSRLLRIAYSNTISEHSDSQKKTD